VNRSLESPVLVGRRRELERLSALLDRAAAGEPVVALVAGEAGVGKSRLVREVARDASRRGLRVLIGGCVELGGDGMPLAPLVDMLRSIARTVPSDHLDECFGPARREFARLLPELDPGVAPGAASEVSATQLYEHVHGLLTRLAATRPTLIVVEDLHWADRSTRDLIVFLVQTLRELGVMLLLTYRSDELHRRHPLRPLIVGWERIRSVEKLDIGRFSRAQVAEQLHAIRDDRPASSFVTVVFERSQGNAFLVEEILAAVDGGADPGDLPPSLRDVLLARTETVSEDAQRVLRAASASAPRVEERLLEAVGGLGEERLYPALREAVEHHLLVVDPTGRGYAFRHELTRDAVYDDMLPGERVRLHAVYGSALTGDPGLLGDDSAVAATLAHHWYAALDLPRALAASVQAGRQAITAYAPAEALRHLERAMQIWPRVPDAAERTGVPWLRLGLMAADAAVAAGELNHGLSIVDEMLADLGPETDPISRAEAVERRASVLRTLGRDAEAATELTATLAVLPPHSATTTHAAVLASLANSLMRTNDMEESARTARRAASVAAEAGAIAEQAGALITLGLATAYLGDADAGLVAMREGVALAERHHLYAMALRGYINLSDGLELLGRHGEAAETARAGVALAARVGYSRSFGAMLAGNLAEPLIGLGRWREAQDVITESLADEPHGSFASTLLLTRGELELWQGDREAGGPAVGGAPPAGGAGRPRGGGPRCAGRPQGVRLGDRHPVHRSHAVHRGGPRARRRRHRDRPEPPRPAVRDLRSRAGRPLCLAVGVARPAHRGRRRDARCARRRHPEPGPARPRRHGADADRTGPRIPCPGRRRGGPARRGRRGASLGVGGHRGRRGLSAVLRPVPAGRGVRRRRPDRGGDRERP
jgi:tetratricopeptide (TPR) repeat protein